MRTGIMILKTHKCENPLHFIVQFSDGLSHTTVQKLVQYSDAIWILDYKVDFLVGLGLNTKPRVPKCYKNVNTKNQIC